MDILKDMYQQNKLSEEHWLLVQNVRKLGAIALRSQGIQTRIQNHSRRWGMPHITTRDPFCHSNAEQKWRHFQSLIALYAHHGFINREILSVVLYETPQKQRIKEAHLHETLSAIDAAYRKLKKRF